MKISKKTFDILKNFSGIRSSIYVDKGNMIRTVSPAKNIMAEVKVDESFPKPFAIFDLGKFIATTSLFNEPDYEFDDKYVVVNSQKGGAVQYFYADEKLVEKANKAADDMKKQNLALAEKLGAIARQLAAPGRIEALRLTTFGTGSDQGAGAIARSIQRGYLRGIVEGVNDVNAPSKLKALGVEVQTIRSSAEADYKELILVEAVLAGGKIVSVAGTVIGKAQSPRIVSINGRTLEFVPEGMLLLIENQDQPGIIGALGTLLAKERVNIANMALSRSGGSNALAVYQLDTAPGDAAIAEILRNPAIVSAKLIEA
jgi:hypothetical protein